MNQDAYIVIPIGVTLLIELFTPFIFSLNCPDVWFAPSPIICALVYIGICIILGFTLKDAYRIDNKDIIIFTWILFVFNLLWALSVKRFSRFTLVLLFITLLCSYYVYNEIFLSSLTHGEDTLYLNLYSTIIVWFGFMITMVFDYQKDKRIKMRL